jgi:pimeloyl-ACP methyl ester carboxylesterase
MAIHLDISGSGRKILFIHGSGCNSTIWHRQRDALRKSMEVALVDLPGHGKSSDDGCSTIEQFSDVVFEAAGGTDTNRYYVTGHSLGGAIAMTMALHRPEQIEGLILIGSGARLRVLPNILEGIFDKREETLRLIASLSFAPGNLPALREEGYTTMAACLSNIIHRDFAACNNFDIMSALPSISAPTLVICGLEDALTPVKYSKYLADNIPRAQLAIIQGAGHMVMMEKPDEMSDAIAAFCKMS